MTGELIRVVVVDDHTLIRQGIVGLLQSQDDIEVVGEANTGYIAAVKPPGSAEVQALISSVNSKRKAEFEKTANKTTATIAQVSNRFYELAVERTASGHYYQDERGNWKRK